MLTTKSIKYRINEVVEWSNIAQKMFSDKCTYDKTNYNDHLTENLYKKLEIDIKTCEASGANSDGYKSQLSTLKKLISSLSN
jgi:hypothetical protein